MDSKDDNVGTLHLFFSNEGTGWEPTTCVSEIKLSPREANTFRLIVKPGPCQNRNSLKPFIADCEILSDTEIVCVNTKSRNEYRLARIA